MSTTENEIGQLEQRSSVKITTNAKGEAQVEVKVYVGADAETVEAAATKTVQLYQDTVAAVRPAA